LAEYWPIFFGGIGIRRRAARNCAHVISVLYRAVVNQPALVRSTDSEMRHLRGSEVDRVGTENHTGWLRCIFAQSED
jgi:hypothetical protein